MCVELYQVGISAKDDAGATARLTREISRYQELSKQEARLKRPGEAQCKMSSARASYARSLEVRDRIAGSGATTMVVGLAMGMPIMTAVKSYNSMEDAMKDGQSRSMVCVMIMPIALSVFKRCRMPSRSPVNSC